MLQPSLMMDRPLLISDVIEHAAAQFGGVQVVSRETHGAMFRYTYAECAARARKLASALRRIGMTAGDAVATLAWNNHRHLESLLRVSGSGMVIHTCNPRLHLKQLDLHPQSRRGPSDVFRRELCAAVGRIAPHLPGIRACICLSEAAKHARAWRSRRVRFVLRGVHRPAAGTNSTGRSSTNARRRAFATRPAPRAIRKGALYSHRAIVLNALDGMPARGAVAVGPGRRSCRRCRCSTSTAGAFPMPRRSAAPNWCCPGLGWTGRPVRTDGG